MPKFFTLEFVTLLISPLQFPSTSESRGTKTNAAPQQATWRDRYDPNPSHDLGLIPPPVRSPEVRPYYDAVADAKLQKAYYKDFDLHLEDPVEAYAQLSQLVKDTHTTTLEYKPEKYLYPWVDVRPNGQLESIYSPLSTSQVTAAKREAVDAAVAQMAAMAALAPETSAAAMALTEAYASLNCEHVVPQSWYAGKEPMRGDLHHLFACDSRCNSFRGNRAFREAQEGECGETCSIENKVEHCGVRTDGETGFIPQGGKGPAARATLYFILRYPKKARAYRPEDIDTLLKWHKAEPPTLHEKHRNVAIQELQGNRNPFIDHPDWAAKVDFKPGLLKRAARV